jgi:protease-4
VACAADKVLANPGTITGSIGVVMQFSSMEKLFDKLGLRFVTIKSGKFKDIGSVTRPMSEKEKQILQGVIDNVYNQFVEVVAKSRDIPREKVLDIADGRIFTGTEAKQVGLVDEIGSLKDAVKIASSMAGIIGEPEIVKPKKHKFSWRRLLDRFGIISRVTAVKPYSPLYLLYQYCN